MLYVGFGPNSLHQAGKVYDGAHLHTFMSDQALNEAVAHFRAGEREVGRCGGKLWSVFATACDVSEERYLKLIVARLATYLQIPGYGEALVNVNGWDMETLHAFRRAPIVANMTGAIDSVASYTELADIEKLILNIGDPQRSATPRPAPSVGWINSLPALMASSFTPARRKSLLRCSLNTKKSDPRNCSQSEPIARARRRLDQSQQVRGDAAQRLKPDA